MRTVYPTDEIPHLWAHQTTDYARNPQGNFYFRGPTIYSYGSHFPIATFKKVRGKTCVFFTTHGSSVTTSKHIGQVRCSLPGGVKVLYVDDILGKVGEALTYHKKRVKDYIKRFALSVNISQRKKRLRELYQVIHAAKEFCKFFGYSDKFAEVPANLDELVAKAKAAVKAAAVADARRKAKAEENRRLAHEKFINEELPEIIAKWRSGAGDDGWEFRKNGVPTMLRIKGGEVETTMGARFPLRHALKVLPLVERLLLGGKTFHTNGQKIRLGHYHLDSIDEDGTVNAGCHHIPKDEVMLLIEELKQPQYADIDLTVSDEEYE